MPRVNFDQLLDVYRHTSFDAQGDEGLLSIASPEVLATISEIEDDERLAEDANLAVLVDPKSLAIGQQVRIRVAAPKLTIGLLIRNFDDLLHAPEARLTEPRAYYVIEGGFDRSTNPAPELLASYRKILELTEIFAEAASYLDRTRQELVFFREGKFVIPVRYSAETIKKLSVNEANRLIEILRDEVHKDQKLGILAESIVHICESQANIHRFAYILENLETLVDEVRKGYRLFASSFSYSKIRNELENAKVEYIAKIHKTLIDIQGQLLGIPVATIIVATQLKRVESCGVEFWTNVAILSGAWIFVALLSVAVVNQWLTLSSISSEIERQKRKLATDYAAIGDQFVDVFSGLAGRIRWHRGALFMIEGIALIGALFATVAYHRLSVVEMNACLVGPSVSSSVIQHSGIRRLESEMHSSHLPTTLSDITLPVRTRSVPSLVGVSPPAF